LRFAVGTHRLAELTCFGRTYPAADALRVGLVDEAVAGESVLDRAIAVATEFAALSPGPLRHTRTQIRRPVLDRISQQRATDDLIHQMWDSPAGRQAINDYVARALHR
jgi:enoyl-CoA hydratase/carnithine racemase